MIVGLLTTPLPFVAVASAAAGALLMAAVSFAMSSRAATKATERTKARREAERRETIALRKIIAACDREAALGVVRRIASEALYPRAIALHDQAPIIPEAQSHG